MSPGPADQVNAKELSARAAVVDRHYELAQLERVAGAGGLPGTRIEAQLRFGSFDGRPTVDVRVEGATVVTCQRCLQPCASTVAEQALVMVVGGEDEDVPGGHEPFVGSPEHLSLAALIEEQVLLAMPLVPMHEPGDPQCLARGAEGVSLAPSSVGRSAATSAAAAAEKQTPFANLRELLDQVDERGPRKGE